MLKLFREILKVGEATLHYPFEPIEQMPGFRGKPHHDPELCIACAACAIACPPNALNISTDLDQGIRTWSLFTGRCIYCARCEEVCPTGAITLSPDFELAVMNKQDLFEKADYKLAACQKCGLYFAPAKELDYVFSLLNEKGLEPEVLEGTRTLLEMCPDCRRKNDVPKIVDIFQEKI
ncbi:MAG TPA: formate hydrogenlyase complex iron-sulfur subunit [Anaerolineales bacterium]|nr:formate hydrogenlyase complex iron-sulfur subunit [Anaerolineales bacterium]